MSASDDCGILAIDSGDDLLGAIHAILTVAAILAVDVAVLVRLAVIFLAEHLCGAASAE